MSWSLDRLYKDIDDKCFIEDMGLLETYCSGIETELKSNNNLDVSEEYINTLLTGYESILKIHEKLQYYCYLRTFVNKDVQLNGLNSSLYNYEGKLKVIKHSIIRMIKKSTSNYTQNELIKSFIKEKHDSSSEETEKMINSIEGDIKLWNELYLDMVHRNNGVDIEDNELLQNVVAKCFYNIKQKKSKIAELLGYTSLLSKTNRESYISDDIVLSYETAMDKNAHKLQEKIIEVNNANVTNPLLKQVNRKDALKILLSSLEPLGSEVVSKVNEWLTNDFVLINESEKGHSSNFCVPIRPLKEIRVLISKLETYDDIVGLSHELGHAYHFHVLMRLPYFDFDFPIAISELPSTFFAHLTLKYIIENEEEENTKVSMQNRSNKLMLDDILQMHSRFCLEQEVVSCKETGKQSAIEMNHKMNKILVKYYGEDYKKYNVDLYQWVKKSQFYMTNRDYYNYTYSMGNFLSIMLNEELNLTGELFIDKYERFLVEASTRSFSEAFKILDKDVSSNEFWENQIKSLLS